MRALLAYLAVTAGQRHARDKLADLFHALLEAEGVDAEAIEAEAVGLEVRAVRHGGQEMHGEVMRGGDHVRVEILVEPTHDPLRLVLACRAVR